ncbi:MAG: hypothetical protein OXD38_01790, partial [Aestuariivita sp.]|nr:hypothetical protein [Aestuariivita sp.]
RIENTRAGFSNAGHAIVNQKTQLPNEDVSPKSDLLSSDKEGYSFLSTRCLYRFIPDRKGGFSND